MSTTPENVKSLFWISEPAAARELEYVPHLYLEAKIDFCDVRTGFTETFNINRAVEIPSNKSKPFWDDDAVVEIDPKKLGPVVPKEAQIIDLPGHVDGRFIAWMETQFVEYLLRAFTVKVYRNYGLDVYSSSGESLNDFIIRCVDLYKGAMYSEFDSAHEVFIRRLERLQQKYLGIEDSEELEKFKTDSYNRELFYRISERISGLFLRTEFSIQHVGRPSDTSSRAQELEERLRDLHQQAREAVIKILDSYEDKIKSVDEYILHPTMKNVHFVSSCILWKPGVI
ncbi:MAG: hypothetical protein JXR49_00105 [Acidobacteria bacterium]|nr:hypothetical protein [Acidobacteriota bacterium]